MLRRLNNEEDAIAIITGILILGLGALIVMSIMSFFIIDMLTRNILPICIGITLIIAIPIFAKGWYYSKTKKEYKKEGGGLFG